MITARILHKDDTFYDLLPYTKLGYRSRKVIIRGKEYLILLPEGRHEPNRSIKGYY